MTPVSTFLTPDWSLPRGIRAAISTRAIPGFSKPPYQQFNLGDHVGDTAEDVAANRMVLQRELGVEKPIPWLSQVHGTVVHEYSASSQASLVGDACFTRSSGVVCAVLTADCLPILLCTQRGDAVAAVHAGWRGLLAGVIEATVKRMEPASQIIAFIGPAIGPTAFEVGDEVRNAFVSANAYDACAFLPSGKKFLADLPMLARLRLERLGVHDVTLSGLCTVREPEFFYSHRREQGRTGRFASLIWIE